MKGIMNYDDIPHTKEIKNKSQGNQGEDDVEHYLKTKLRYHVYKIIPDSFKIDFYCRFRDFNSSNKLITPTKGGFYVQVKSTSSNKRKLKDGIKIKLKAEEIDFWINENLHVIIISVDYIDSLTEPEFYWASFHDDIQQSIQDTICDVDFEFTKKIDSLQGFIKKKFSAGQLGIPSLEIIEKHLKNRDQYYYDHLKEITIDMIEEIMDNKETLDNYPFLKSKINSTYDLDLRIFKEVYSMTKYQSIDEFFASKTILLNELLENSVSSLHNFERILEIISLLERVNSKIIQSEFLMNSLKLCPKCGSDIVETNKTIYSGDYDDMEPSHVIYRIECERIDCDYVFIDESFSM